MAAFEAQAANIIFIGNSTTADTGYVSFLEANGHSVDFVHSTGTTGYGTLDADKIAALNAADLVIMSRNGSSGDFSGGTEPTEWNSITTPLLLHNPYLVRVANWNWFDNTSGPGNQLVTSLTVTTEGASHPIFDGATGALFDPATNVGYNPAVTATAGNAVVLATAPDGRVAISEWQAGVPFHNGTTPQTPLGPRVYFALGDAAGANLEYFQTLSANGQDVLLNTVNYLIPEPSTSALFVLAGLGLACRRRRVS